MRGADWWGTEGFICKEGDITTRVWFVRACIPIPISGLSMLVLIGTPKCCLTHCNKRNFVGLAFDVCVWGMECWHVYWESSVWWQIQLLLMQIPSTCCLVACEFWMDEMAPEVLKSHRWSAERQRQCDRVVHACYVFNMATFTKTSAVMMLDVENTGRVTGYLT